MRMNRNGFTLLELLVVVTIVGILAAVAIPNLNGYIRRSRVSEGEAGLAAVRTAMRAKFIENGPTDGYSTIPTGDVSGPTPNLGINTTDLDGRFFSTSAYQIQNTTATTFCINVSGANTAPKQGLVAGTQRSMNESGTIFASNDCTGTELN